MELTKNQRHNAKQSFDSYMKRKDIPESEWENIQRNYLLVCTEGVLKGDLFSTDAFYYFMLQNKKHFSFFIKERYGWEGARKPRETYEEFIKK